MSVIGSNILAGASGQGTGPTPPSTAKVIQRSIAWTKYNSLGADTDFERTFDNGDRKTWALSLWIKRAEISDDRQYIVNVEDSLSYNSTQIYFDTNDTFVIQTVSAGITRYQLKTNTVFADPHAWYHFVIVHDTTQANASDRLCLYVNGIKITSFAYLQRPLQNAESYLNSPVVHTFAEEFSGYMAEVHFVTGINYVTENNFGFFDGKIWRPRNYTGNYSVSPTYTNYPAVITTSPPDLSSDVANIISSSGALYLSYFLAGSASIKVIFSPALEDVVNLKFTGGAFAEGEQFSLKVNDTIVSSNLVTSTSFITVTITKQDVNSIELISDGDGWSLGGLTYSQDGSTYITPSGTPTHYQGSGKNGFYLDFQDNSSVAALGLDRSGLNNNFTLNNITANVDNPKYDPAAGAIDAAEAAKMFDGNPNTYGRADHAYIGFTYSGRFIRVKVACTINARVALVIEPQVYGAFDDVGVWSNLSAGELGDNDNEWYIPPNTTAYATFRFPYNWDGVALLGTSVGQNIYLVEAWGPDEADIVSFIDTPTNYIASSGNNGGNYATMSPIGASNNNGILQNANLRLYVQADTDDFIEAKSSIAVLKSDVYKYCELSITQCQNLSNGNPNIEAFFGIGDFHASHHTNSGSYVGVTQTGQVVSYPGGNVITTIEPIQRYDVWGIAVEDNIMVFYRNGVSQGLMLHEKVGEFYIHVYNKALSSVSVFDINFGQRPFVYPMLTGFAPIASVYMPPPPITDTSLYYDAKLYTGNGTSRTITGYNFDPALVWVKNRTSRDPHVLSNIVRGANASIETNSNNKENLDVDRITSFISNGFTVGSSDSVNNGIVPDEYVAWAWKGGSTTVVNTDGGVGSNVSVSAQSGFSVVEYIGVGADDTVGHGLGSTIDFMIVKNLTDDSTRPTVVFKDFDDRTSNFMYTTSRSGVRNTNNIWNNGFTSSTFGISDSPLIGELGKEYLAYCWTEVDQYIKVGKYIGNGVNNGPRIDCNFRPAWVLIKRGEPSGDWMMFDSARNPEVGVDGYLEAGTTEKELIAETIELLSTGFKVITFIDQVNAENSPYFYFAIAELPFGSNGGIAR